MVLNMSIQQAERKYSTVARKAAERELTQMVQRKVLSYLSRADISNAKGKKIIRSFLFFKEKFNRDGSLERLKARLVAGGHMMDRTVYPDTRSPTVSSDSLLMTIAIAAAEKRSLLAVDIGNAYLEADMTGEEVWMTLDAWCTTILVKLDPTSLTFVNGRGELVVRLDKALYGCLTSAKEWFEHLRGVLLSLGYEQNPYDE
jgi:hypothetical protein